MNTFSLQLMLLSLVVVVGSTFITQTQTSGVEDCGYTFFGPCTLKTVFALVQQAVNDFSSAYGMTNPAGVLFVINKGGSQYRAGKLSVQVYTDNNVKVADSADPSTNGWTLQQIFDKTQILTDPYYGDKLRAAGTAGGSWTYAYVYNWSMAGSPTPQRTWTSSVVVNGTRYSIASSLDNIELGAMKETCTADFFTDCSAAVAYYLAEHTADEFESSGMNSSQSANFTSNFFSSLSSPEFHVTGGFDVSVFSASGELLVEGKTGKGVPSSAFADFVAAAAAGGSWVVYNTTTQEERQAWVTSASVGGATYYFFSSIATAETSPCPSCNCPVCAQQDCPVCYPVSDCDTTEVTKVKFDFEGIA